MFSDRKIMRYPICTLVLLCILNLYSSIVSAQNYRKIVEDTAKNSAVISAFQHFAENRKELITAWKEVARIYSPSGNEVLRAKYMVNKFEEYGIENAHIDNYGNAVCYIEGIEPGPTIVWLATMDDLQPVAEMVKSWNKPIEERDGKLIGPGTNIGATCMTVLGLAKMFTLEEVKLKGRLYLVGVVQEETGLLGIKGFLKDHQGEIDYLVDIMSGIGGISYGAIGIHWFKVHFKGPKGHTLRGGLPNVTRGVARAVDQIFDIHIPQNPPEVRSKLNISMLGAGTVFNHKHDDGWFSVDLRSMDNNTLLSIKEEVISISKQVAEDQGFEMWIEPFSEIPAGQIPGARESDLVRVAEEATRYLGYEPRLSNSGSSNMNVSVSQNILSITTSGDRGGGRNTSDEYANIEPNLMGVKLNFLIGYILSNIHTN